MITSEEAHNLTETTPVSGTSTIDGIPEVQTEEELAKLLEGNADPAQPAPAAKKDEEDGKEEPKKAEPAKKQAGVIGEPAAPAAAKEDKKEDEDEEGADEDGKDAHPLSKYPSMLHYFKDKYELEMNLEDVKEVTPEQSVEVIDEMINRMTVGVNKALENYQYIEELLKDDEVKQLLKAKAENKSLKDLYTQFAQTDESLSDDLLAIKDFKTRYPKSPDEAIQGMVKSLKDNGQFEPFVKGLREQHQEEQSLQAEQAAARAEAEKKAAQEQRARELEEFNEYVSGLNVVYGVPVTDEMRKKIVKISTAPVDENGMTELDHALQSNEGIVLASIGIALMQDMMKNGSSLEANRRNNRFIDKVFQRPDALSQSGGNNDQRKDELDPALLNNF